MVPPSISLGGKWMEGPVGWVGGRGVSEDGPGGETNKGKDREEEAIWQFNTLKHNKETTTKTTV